jgi:hypothetical protein
MQIIQNSILKLYTVQPLEVIILAPPVYMVVHQSVTLAPHMLHLIRVWLSVVRIKVLIGLWLAKVLGLELEHFNDVN